MFSIIIPSWNNLAFLKLCIASIRKHSVYPHEIIVHINEGSDGTLEWVKSEKDLIYTFSPQNSGVCYAVNQAASFATKEYIVFMNDDMFCCPNWDKALLDTIQQLNTACFLLSSNMIEPMGRETGATLVRNFGTQPAEFQEEKLLNSLACLPTQDYYGTAQPTILHRDWWFKVGGYSVEFTPGMGSDNDLCMKMWFSGCRIFRIVGNSLVYHFGQKSTLRIKKNNSRLKFMQKWGISTSMLNRYYLRFNKLANDWVLPEPDLNFSYYFNLIRIRLILATHALNFFKNYSSDS